MNSKPIANYCAVILCWFLLAATTASAAPNAAIERVFKKSDKVYVVQNGQESEIREEIVLPDDIKVKTNSTFRVQGGKIRTLLEGQSLSADGWLTSPNGSVVPVIDHVLMQSGHAVLVKDGEDVPITQTLTLGNQTTVEPDGSIRTPDGRSVRLLDGQMYKLDGTRIPTKDTISLQNGQVTVQKDGSVFNVAPNRSLMMNDGTKVFGDGRVLSRDGTPTTLVEGQILVVPGVITP
jgi:hypothetical protein